MSTIIATQMWPNINRCMVIIIWFQFDLIRFLSVNFTLLTSSTFHTLMVVSMLPVYNNSYPARCGILTSSTFHTLMVVSMLPVYNNSYPDVAYSHLPPSTHWWWYPCNRCIIIATYSRLPPSTHWWWYPCYRCTWIPPPTTGGSSRPLCALTVPAKQDVLYFESVFIYIFV